MTEQEWQACTDPEKQVPFVLGKPGERKQRLCACAWARSFLGRVHTAPTAQMEPYLPWLADQEWLTQLAAAEQFADGQISVRALRAARQQSGGPYNFFLRVCHASAFSLMRVCESLRHVQQEFAAPSNPEVSALLRDVFGLCLFRPLAVAPWWRMWNNQTILHLAQAAYDQRQMPTGALDPDHLAILADALEEAGCDEQNILDHLRGPGPHTLGCWPVDLVLNKQ